MFDIQYAFHWGFALGFIVADPDEEDDITFGLSILIGPFALFIEKLRLEEE